MNEFKKRALALLGWGLIILQVVACIFIIFLGLVAWDFLSYVSA